MQNNFKSCIVKLNPNSPYGDSVIVQGIKLDSKGVVISSKEDIIKLKEIAQYCHFEKIEAELIEDEILIEEKDNVLDFDKMSKDQLISYICDNFDNQDAIKYKSYKKSDLIWLIEDLQKENQKSE